MKNNSQPKQKKDKVFTIILKKAAVLISFLKQFNVIDTRLLLEITSDKRVLIKSHTNSRTAVMAGSLGLVDISEIPAKKKFPRGAVLCGILNTKRFIGILSNFPKNDNINISFHYNNNENGELECKKIILSNNYKEYSFGCANRILFRYIQDNIEKEIFDLSKSIFSFDITNAKLKEIEADAKLEDGAGLEIAPCCFEEQNFVCFKGRDFSTKIPIDKGSVVKDTPSATISKDYLRYLDKGSNYSCHLTETSVLFHSDKYNIRLGFGRVMECEETENTINM